MFKQSKKSTGRKVGEVVGGAIGAAMPRKKKSHTKRNIAGFALASAAVAVVAGAFTKPKNPS